MLGVSEKNTRYVDSSSLSGNAVDALVSAAYSTLMSQINDPYSTLMSQINDPSATEITECA